MTHRYDELENYVNAHVKLSQMKSNQMKSRWNQILHFFFLWEGKNHGNQQAQPT